MNRSKAHRHPFHNAENVPILWKFWSDEGAGVWNRVTKQLAVAVFGDSLEVAQRNFADGIEAHLEGLREIGQLEPTLERLRPCAKLFLSVEDIPTGKVYSRVEGRVTDKELCAFA